MTITATDDVTLTGSDADELAKAKNSWMLVERAQAGDADAFAQLYLMHRDRIFRFLYRRFADAEACRDMVAETFCKAWRRIGAVSWQGRDIGAWFTTIAHNLLRDRFKSQRHQQEVVVEPFIMSAMHADAPDRTREAAVEDCVVQYLTSVELLRAVKELTPEQYECIVLRFLRGLSILEVAEIMGKEEGAVKALTFRAFRRIRRALPEDFAMAA